MNFKNLLGKTGMFLKENKTGILTGIGILGMGATMFFVAKQTPKYLEVKKKKNDALEDIEVTLNLAKVGDETYTLEDYNNDKKIVKINYIKDIIKVYGLPALTFILSAASLIFAHKLSNAEKAALASALTLSESGFAAYRQRVCDLLGDEKENEIFHNIKEKEIETVNEKGEIVKKTVSIGEDNNYYSFAYDSNTSESYEEDRNLNLTYILQTWKLMNSEFENSNGLLLIDVLEALDIDLSKLPKEFVEASHRVGWVKKPGDSESVNTWIDFGICDKNGVVNNWNQCNMLLDLPFYLSFNVMGDVLTGVNGIKYTDVKDWSKSRRKYR